MRLLSRVRLLSDGRVIGVVYALTTFVASWQKYATGHANNFRIFRDSFFNLLAGRDVYALHPEYYYDYFKYSPTFALLMAPFAALPELAGAMAWNFCNVFALFAAIWLLNFSREQKALVLWLILIELLTSVQNFQSNALVAAFIIATFIALERGQPEVAGLCVALGSAIKIFGGAAALFVLFYPRKLRFLLATIIAAVLLVVLPLLVTSPAQLRWQYGNWFFLLQSDYLSKEKLSVMSWLQAWFGVDWPKGVVQIAGGFFLLFPVVLALARRLWRREQSTPLESNEFRLIFLASLLVFLVIFNHKAESPMFILAVTGVAIWYSACPQNCARNFVVAFVIVFTSLGSTDLVPRHFRDTISTPLVIKVIPCIIAWFVMQWELLRLATSRVILSREAESQDSAL
jgi:hypothetical protein